MDQLDDYFVMLFIFIRSLGSLSLPSCGWQGIVRGGWWHSSKMKVESLQAFFSCCPYLTLDKHYYPVS